MSGYLDIIIISVAVVLMVNLVASFVMPKLVRVTARALGFHVAFSAHADHERPDKGVGDRPGV